MLSEVNAVATIGVRNLKLARKFYEEKLGFIPAKGGMEGEVQFYKSGDSLIEVYHSDFAGTNKTTSLTFRVGKNLRREVEELKSRGVQFEHYDFPDLHMDGDIHVMGDTKAVWFKDPDGNILSLTN